MFFNARWSKNSTPFPMKKRENHEPEIHWLDLIVMSIGTEQWKHVFEVWENFEAMIPPHAIYRKISPRNQRGRRATVRGHMVTWIGGITRYAIRNGIIERSIPIGQASSAGGGYKLRLTDKGAQRLKRIKRYMCTDCLHFGISRALKDENRTCGHCGSRHLRLY